MFHLGVKSQAARFAQFDRRATDGKVQFEQQPAVTVAPEVFENLFLGSKRGVRPYVLLLLQACLSDSLKAAGPGGK
jgi:hypothetical protein